jgi:cytochrome c oxidase subunit 4
MAELGITQRTYYIVFVTLLLLTVTTVAVSFVELGGWHLFAALAIAGCKAVLVLLFFMHVLHSPRLTWLIIGAALYWFGILFVLTLSDYLTRGWMKTSPGDRSGLSVQLLFAFIHPTTSPLLE